jgi:hypothetical protein
MTGKLDFTRTQMVLTMKMTSFAYCLYDGTYDTKNVFGNLSQSNLNDKQRKIYLERRRYAIKTMPNILEYFGYVYCFASVLVGPSLEFTEYVHTIHSNHISIDAYGPLIGEYHNTELIRNDTRNDNPTKKELDDDNDYESGSIHRSYEIPSSLMTSLEFFFQGLFCLFVHLIISSKFPLKRVCDPTFLKSYNMMIRLVYTYIALFGERFKYYFVWKIAEGGCIMGGFGYDPYSKNVWIGAKNVNIIDFETATNMQSLSRAWNLKTQRWLERYTYLRSGKSLILTYTVSALWHGLYPGFYLFFLSVPLLTEIERLCRQKLNPYFMVKKDDGQIQYSSTYILLCWILTTLSLNYIAQMFSLQTWERGITVLNSYYHIPHILFITFYIILKYLPIPKSIDNISNKVD